MNVLQIPIFIYAFVKGSWPSNQSQILNKQHDGSYVSTCTGYYIYYDEWKGICKGMLDCIHKGYWRRITRLTHLILFAYAQSERNNESN